MNLYFSENYTVIHIMVATLQQHRATTGANEARMCSSTWKSGFKERGGQRGRQSSYNSSCRRGLLGVFLLALKFLIVVTSIMYLLKLYEEENIHPSEFLTHSSSSTHSQHLSAEKPCKLVPPSRSDETTATEVRQVYSIAFCDPNTTIKLSSFSQMLGSLASSTNTMPGTAEAIMTISLDIPTFEGQFSESTTNPKSQGTKLDCLKKSMLAGKSLRVEYRQS